MVILFFQYISYWKSNVTNIGRIEGVEYLSAVVYTGVVQLPNPRLTIAARAPLEPVRLEQRARRLVRLGVEKIRPSVGIDTSAATVLRRVCEDARPQLAHRFPRTLR